MQLKDSKSGGLAPRMAGDMSCIVAKRTMPSMAAHTRTRLVFIADENLLKCGEIDGRVDIPLLLQLGLVLARP